MKAPVEKTLILGQAQLAVCRTAPKLEVSGHHAMQARALLQQGMNLPLSPAENDLVADLIRCGGRDPALFHAGIQPDGLVRVVGPRGTACYPRDNWLTRFSRHLDRAFFDAGLLPPRGPQFSRKTEHDETQTSA